MYKRKLSVFGIIVITLVGSSVFHKHSNASEEPSNDENNTRPALNVTTTQPSIINIPATLTANGSIAAWQEAIIGAEIGELRLKDVRVEVGQSVTKNQLLALFDEEPVQVSIAQAKASLAEAEANFAEASINADRVKQVISSGALSAQQINQFLTGAKTAQAKVALAKAQLDNQLLRLRHTRVIATDDGIISSRTATLGAVASPGQELFRLIRKHRLEWRAEVTASEMAQLKTGLVVNVQTPNVANVTGKIRYLAPTIDTQSRNGLIYVDLPDAATKGLRVGMYAQGSFQLGDRSALTIPQDAISLREGFSYVFRLGELKADQAKVSQVKVQLGSRTADRFEVLSGINQNERLVANGAAFLADGDIVRVIEK